MPLYELKKVVVESRQDGKSTFRVPKHLELIKKVGSGAYGYVASFKDTKTGENIAVKKITNAFDDLVDGKRILREVKLLRRFDHDNIIRILDMYPPASPQFDDIYIVTDLMETDLSRVINSRQPLGEEHHQYLMHQVLRGLLYLHAMGVVHRDLKPSNLLVNKNCDLKICDFGLARVIYPNEDQPQTTPTDYVVTRWYRAPEVVLLASEYTVAIDIWAVGCILCELINRRPIFPGKDHLDQISKIILVMGSPTDEELLWLPEGGSAMSFLSKVPTAPKVDWASLLPSASAAGVEVVREMLRFDPTVRVTATQAIRLPYFANLFAEEDLAADTNVKAMDWAFDNFSPTKPVLQNYIYLECMQFHPELLKRDQGMLSVTCIDRLLANAEPCALIREL